MFLIIKIDKVGLGISKRTLVMTAIHFIYLPYEVSMVTKKENKSREKSGKVGFSDLLS